MDTFIKISVGKLEKSELINIVREIKALWRYSENIWPSGDRTRVAQIKATQDKAGNFYIHMNEQALKMLVLRCKDIPPFEFVDEKASADKPMPADFAVQLPE